MVEEFMKVGGQKIPHSPGDLDDYPFALRARLIQEEAGEYTRASGIGPYPVLQKKYLTPSKLEMIDALCDLLYVTYGTASAMGIDIEPFFAEVHRANMNKFPGGKVCRRGDGKIVKPEGWQPPDIMGVYEEMYGDFS
jgi:predicted HAD superfamily Cof-like phosphohydrolase